MITLISPAKRLDFVSPCPQTPFTRPRLIDHSRKLIRILREKSPNEIKRLMTLSDSLAEQNVARYRKWKAPLKLGPSSRPAAFAFMGDVYQSLHFKSLNSDDQQYAQNRLRILSGLYGILRPLDLIAPHRLEMGTPLSNEYGHNLYSFWGDMQTRSLNKEAKTESIRSILNLASEEYFKSVDLRKLKSRVITARFLDSKDGRKFKVMSFYAKRARGAMARWVIQNRIEHADSLRYFDGEGYRYDPHASNDDLFVFIRSHADHKPSRT